MPEETNQEVTNQEVTKPEVAKPPEPSTVAIEIGGETFNVTGPELLQLAQAGGQHLLEKQKTPEPEPEPENTDGPTLESLQKEIAINNEKFKTLKETSERRETLHKFKTDLDSALGQSDLLKEYPSIIDGVKNEVIAKMHADTRLNVAGAVKIVLNDRTKFMEEVSSKQNHANTKVSSILNQVQQATGGVANMEAEKPLTAEHMKSGKSKDDVLGFLLQQKEA